MNRVYCSIQLVKPVGADKHQLFHRRSSTGNLGENVAVTMNVEERGPR